MDRDIRCVKANSFESMAPFREQWDRFVEDTGGDIYMTFDWCRIWWEQYGSGKELKLFLFFSQNDIIAVFPMVLHRLGIWPVSIRVARIVGTFYRCLLYTSEAETVRRLTEQSRS